MSDTSPFVSVIVPTFERPESLARCLRALAGSTYPRDRFEVIVVDDGGQMDVAHVCAAVEGIEVRLVRQGNGGAAAARNRGAATARGEMLLFTDDDCRVTPGWMDTLVDVIRENPEALAGGVTRNELAGNPFACASQLLVNEASRPRADGRPRFVNGNNLAASRAAYESAGGFDETFRTSAGEDREISARFEALGRPLVLTDAAVVGHDSPLTWQRFVKQHTNYGRAAFRLRAHPSPRIDRLRFGSVGFYLGLLVLPVGVAGSPAAWRHAVSVRGLLLVAQVATAAGFLAEWLRPTIVAAPVAGSLKTG